MHRFGCVMVLCSSRTENVGLTHHTIFIVICTMVQPLHSTVVHAISTTWCETFLLQEINNFGEGA